jgi:hypothetical protein
VSGLCECGCGNATSVIQETRVNRGLVRGQFRRFVQGHQSVRPLHLRFWEKVQKGGDDDCWVWTGALVGVMGYGQTTVRNRLRRYAHRVAYELAHGPVPADLYVLHHCDNPRCVNPAHLFLGTILDNTRDMLAKGRGNKARGERQGHHKLAESEVRAILQRIGGFRLPRGLSKIIAAEFGVGPDTIRLIARRRTWKHVTLGLGAA